jgi:hypothetical protein
MFVYFFLLVALRMAPVEPTFWLVMLQRMGHLARTGCCIVGCRLTWDVLWGNKLPDPV